MFTIKLYTSNGYRQRILSAEGFTVLRSTDGKSAEITAHQKDMLDDRRFDLSRDGTGDSEYPTFSRAIIENGNGRTTEIIDVGGPVE